MKYSKQLEKMIRRPLMLAVVATFAVGVSNSQADGMTENESHSDSNMAAKNWDNANGPDPLDGASTYDVAMVAESWRSLDQPVTHSDSKMAAKNWNNIDGPDTNGPLYDVAMIAESWRSLDQPVTHSDSKMAAKNWNNPNGPDDLNNVEPFDKDSLAAELE